MDLSGYSFMDQDSDAVLLGDTALMDYDHVRWQGSQTANQALNQLIRTSVNEPVLAKAKENVNVGTSRSWQREPSFDQIPGFSLLSTTDSGSGGRSSSSSSSVRRTPQSTSTSSGKSLSSSRLSHPRLRPSPALAASTSNAQPSSSSITIPFFDKTNPSQFLDILKGVSARVDANAGVRPRNSTGGMDPLPSSHIIKGRKRPRGVSLGSTSETLVERVKRGRIEALRESGGVNPKAKDRDKGKGRVILGTDEGAGSSLDGASASRNAGGECSRPSLREKGDMSGMDIDCREGEGDKSMLGLSDQANNHHSSSSNSSQTKMPPPPPPGPRIKHPTGTTSLVLPAASSSASASTSASVSTSISRLTITSRASHNRNESSVNDTKPQSTSQTPKYHPLLLEPPSKPQPKPHSKIQNPPPRVQSVVAHPNLYPKVKSETRQGVPVPAQKPQPSVIVAAPSPSPAPAPLPASLPTSTPHFSSSQSSRPPPLGMRRTHTFPSSSSLSSGGMVPSLQKNGVLPTKQKGFKPPLLSASQPQPRSQVPQPASQVASRVVKEQPSIVRGQSKQHLAGTRAPAPASSNGYASSASNSPHSAGVGGPPSSSLSRSTSNSSASSSMGTSKMAGSRGPSLHARAKPTTMNCNPAGAVQNTHDPGHTTHAPPSSHAAARQVQPQLQPRHRLDSRAPVSVPVGAPTTAIPTKPPPSPVRVASPPLPEPADGDPDSSFGDMSFDMDALEETMRQYD